MFAVPLSIWEALASLSLGMEQCKCWLGNIPQAFSEEQLLHELAAYGVRPKHIRFRQRPGVGQDFFLMDAQYCRCVIVFIQQCILSSSSHARCVHPATHVCFHVVKHFSRFHVSLCHLAGIFFTCRIPLLCCSSPHRTCGASQGYKGHLQHWAVGFAEVHIYTYS